MGAVRSAPGQPKHTHPSPSLAQVLHTHGVENIAGPPRGAKPLHTASEHATSRRVWRLTADGCLNGIYTWKVLFKCSATLRKEDPTVIVYSWGGASCKWLNGF